MDVEGSSEEAVKQYHEQVEKEIDQSLKESKTLIDHIKLVPETQDVFIWFSNVAYSVTARDLDDFYKKKGIEAKRIFTQDPGTFKVIFTYENALKVASIPDNVSHIRTAGSQEQENDPEN